MALQAEKVSFLITGVQKGGTTALYEHLRQGAAVSLSDTKEVHFFDDEDVDWTAPDYGAYHAHFAPFDGRPWGEATPIYSYWPQSLERIAAYNPAMRLILIFRDPVKRAFSHWRMEVERGFDDADFSWAIREGRQRVADAPSGHHRVFSYVERGFYAAQLDRVLALFPRRQLLLLRSEDLQQRPAATVGQISQFLHIEPLETAIAPIRANVGRLPDAESILSNDDAQFLSNLYRPDLDRFAELSGLDVSGWAKEPHG
jgi:hypothetical protein